MYLWAFRPVLKLGRQLARSHLLRPLDRILGRFKRNMLTNKPAPRAEHSAGRRRRRHLARPGGGGGGGCGSKNVQKYPDATTRAKKANESDALGRGSGVKKALPPATRAAAGLCRIAASASSSSPSAASAGGRRRERELPFALAERGMVVGGHRGMGMNAVGAPPGARVGAARERENTLLSFGRAAAHAAVAFVEFDVQVTKDGCPIIFHDDFILTQGTGAVYERRVTDLLLEEFLSYGPQKESRRVSKPLLRRTRDGRVLSWSTEEDDSLCTLQEVFEHVSPRVGFNIELKFDDSILYHRKDLECALQAILQVVFHNARDRPVFFSSFHPDAAQMTRELQSLYPVLFLTEGGTSKHHDSRRNSLNDAIRVCLEYDLHGIVSEVRGVLKNPAAVLRAQESNLALLTYGQLNNVSEAVYVQYLMGVNGVIVDQVEEISNAVVGFSKPDLDLSSTGVDGAKHQAYSQQQLGFLLRLIRELIEQHH